MFKKLLALAVVVTMAVTALAGCTADDAALYMALQKTPETCVTTTTTTFDVSLEEPLSLKTRFAYMDDESVYDVDMSEDNYILRILSGLLSISKVEQVTKKSGNVSETKTTVAMPDATLSFTGWKERGDDGSVVKNILTLPSYARPFLPENLENKRYLEINGIADDIDIGGFILVNPDISARVTLSVKEDGGLADLDPAKTPDISLVANTERTDGGVVYTVKLDGTAAAKFIKAALEPDPASATEDELAEARLKADTYGRFIMDSGILDKGVTVRYTVGPEGYVVRTETDIDITIDMARRAAASDAALENILTNGGSTEFPSEDEEEDGEYGASTRREYGGRFRIAVKQVSEVTGINVPLTVAVPELTDENSIDCKKDAEEYAEYLDARMEWEYGWRDNDVMNAYITMHQPGDTLTLRNTATGAEVTTVPVTRAEIDPDYDSAEESRLYVNTLYFPADDMARILPDLTVTWNEELSGFVVDINDGDMPELYLTEAGVEKLNALAFGGLTEDEFYEQQGDSYEGDPTEGTPYENYYCYDGYTDMIYNGRLYMEYDEYNWAFDMVSRFEDGKYCYYPEEAAEYDEGYMEGNLFYELENVWI